jgi:hypothetical protein
MPCVPYCPELWRVVSFEPVSAPGFTKIRYVFILSMKQFPLIRNQLMLFRKMVALPENVGNTV